MRRVACILSLVVLICLNGEASAGPGPVHVISGAMQHDDGATLAIAAYAGIEVGVGGRASLSLSDGRQVEVTVDCLQLFHGFEGGHWVAASGLDSAGDRWFVGVGDVWRTNPYGDEESFVVADAAADGEPCGVRLEDLVAGVGDFVVGP